MNLKCCYAHFVDDKAEVHLRGSSQRHWVAWPKLTQAASASAKLWTWFLWVQVQASSCQALITSSETYQILLGHCLPWILALSQIQCKRPGEPIVVTVWSLPAHDLGRASISVQVQDRKKNQCPSLKAFLFGWESGFCPTSWIRHTHNSDLFHWVYHFISFKYLFIYWAASGLSWCTRDLISCGIFCSLVVPTGSRQWGLSSYGVQA